MTRLPLALGLPTVLCILGCAIGAQADDRLVFGSFRDADNAAALAARLSSDLGQPFYVAATATTDGRWYRVYTPTATATAAERLRLGDVAAAGGVTPWIDRSVVDTPSVPAERPPATTERLVAIEAAAAAPAAGVVPSVASGAASPPRRAEVYTDFDIGVQTRTFAEQGRDGQGRHQPSLSARLDYHRSWNEGRSELTFTPFLRLDSQDSRRTHGDIRELFYSRIGDTWELHVGARQVFWGVTEFKHLIDIVNQTDLVEDVDGEDKLGQPMVQLSLVRDWGIVDLMLLTGFRERTYPGEDGRFRGPVVEVDEAEYESGAGRHRVDAVVRWSHHLGPLSFGIYQFSGTGRDPAFRPALAGSELVLVPRYHVIDQTGLEAQALFGDWVWKLEAISRQEHGRRFYAYNAGFERTAVGVFGTQSDLGLVAEYMYDERGEAADTLFEHDAGFGVRWRANDIADTTALVAVILDVESDEYVFSLEASRRLGASWLGALEARVFGGVEPPVPGAGFSDADFKSRALQSDDYVQLELTRYF